MMAVLDLNKELFDKYVAEEKQVILVDYWAPWCVYCRRIAPAFEKIAEQYKDAVIFGKLDIDQEPQIAVEQQIEVIPTFVLYKDGQAVDSIVAPDSKAKLEAFLKEALEK